MQVVQYTHHHTTVLKHVGSAKQQEDIGALKRIAREWMEQVSRQERLFSFGQDEGTDSFLLHTYRYAGFRYGLMAETVYAALRRFGLYEGRFPSCRLFLDLVLARLVEPASKRRSQQVLSSSFGVTHTLTALYRALPEIASHQETIEQGIIAFAQKHLSFDFQFVLYDMTTLYFETFREDDLRKRGFSKDNKVGQPQVLVGLVVTREGFPLHVSLFEGNMFEGHTIVPVIRAFQKQHGIRTLTVVADAAMISRDNTRALKEAGLSYIVGARLGTLPIAHIREVSGRLNRRDGAYLTVPTDDGHLICHFSTKRYAKDKHELDTQREKAQQIIAGSQAAVRNKFLVKTHKASYALNHALLEKATLLLGMKGYHTNLTMSERLVMERYADLWRIEQAFRMSKHDLEARPVYHVREQAILAHLLICMTALAVLKWWEIKSGLPAKRIVDHLKSVTDARMVNTITGKETLLRSDIPNELAILLGKRAPH